MVLSGRAWIQCGAMTDLAECKCGLTDWFDQDDCNIRLSAGMPIADGPDEFDRESEWRCGHCGHVVQRPSKRASRLDALRRGVWPSRP